MVLVSTVIKQYEAQRNLHNYLPMVFPIRITFFEWDPHPEPLLNSDIVSDIPSGSIYGIFILTLYLTISDYLSGIYFGILFDILSGTYSDILSGIYSDILSGILSGIYSHILFGIFSGIHSGRCSDIHSDILSGICIWHIFWHFFWHSIWYIFGDSLWLRSSGEHWSGARGGGPAGNALILCLLLGPAGNTAI